MAIKEQSNEGIIKDIERSTGMPSYWKIIVLDLISRQQSEIERLTKEKKTAWQKFKQKVDESIELSMLLDRRVGELTEERDKAKRDNTSLLYNISKVEKKNAKLQKQVDELKEQKAFWEGMHDRVCLKLEEYDDKSEEYENALVMKQCRITELQKQVDELKKDREAVFNEMSERMKAEVAIEKKLGIRKCEQAVKDTPKEIFELCDTPLLKLQIKEEIAKRYGMGGMMEYKRLTKRNQEPKTIFCFQGSMEDFKIYKRLQELEDKIEQGTLKETPENAVMVSEQVWEEHIVNWDKASNALKEQVRKEMAEKFAQELENRLDCIDTILHEDNEEKYLSANELGELIDEIAKEFTEGKI